MLKRQIIGGFLNNFQVIKKQLTLHEFEIQSTLFTTAVFIQGSKIIFGPTRPVGQVV